MKITSEVVQSTSRINYKIQGLAILNKEQAMDIFVYCNKDKTTQVATWRDREILIYF